MLFQGMCILIDVIYVLLVEFPNIKSPHLVC